MSDEILLKCIKEKSKLRIRILLQGYFNDSNCQYPIELKKEACMYIVKYCNIKLSAGNAGKYFYRVKNEKYKDN